MSRWGAVIGVGQLSGLGGVTQPGPGRPELIRQLRVGVRVRVVEVFQALKPRL